MLWLTWLDAGLFLQRPRFNYWPVHVVFVVDKVVLEYIFIKVLWFFPVIIIAIMLHGHLSVTDIIILAVNNVIK